MTVKIDISTVYKHIFSPSEAFWSEENWLNFNKLELQKKTRDASKAPTVSNPQIHQESILLV